MGNLLLCCCCKDSGCFFILGTLKSYSMDYPVLKALHLIFVVSWFAGLFYIFRLFVYHIENWHSNDVRKVLSRMERKLLSFIMLPSAIGSIALGTVMLMRNPALLTQHWMHLKLGAVSILIGYHVFSFVTYKKFAADQKYLSSKMCRLINEIPTLILIIVSFLVFLKSPT